MAEKIDYLEEDFLTVPGQRYALISVVSPQSKQKNDICGVKIRGVFNSQEEGQRHAQRLQKVDTTFNIYLVDMYKWLPIPPDDENIEDNEYTEEKLNEIVKGHKEQQILSKQFFEERKMEQMEDAMKKVKEAEGSSSSNTEPVKTYLGEDEPLELPERDLKGKGILLE